ncbi:HAD family hydrolase [Nocardiopsis mangrovi]|uniref:HAD family hydrolase n=1 Tax=Nocardiopsis mangrovi TaxID=1179818 RepID=A0ABV9DUB0_9ACTN
MPDTSAAPAAIFFDLDDTLLDDQAASTAGLHALMDLLGHPDFPAARRLWDVQTDISFGAYIAGRLTLAEQRRERVRALATQAGHSSVADEHCDDLYQRYLAAHRSAWRAFDDVVPALNAISAAGIRLGVITNGIEALQHEKLAAVDIMQYFPVVVCADSAGAGKPDPRIFHIACQRIGVAPQHAWHVGDQLRADALGAMSGGLRPILIDRHGMNTGQTDLPAINGLEQLLRMAGVAAPSGML